MTDGVPQVTWAPSELELARRQHRRKASGRSVLIAIVSTILFVGVIALVLINTPGWESVKATFFDLSVAKESLPAVLQGLWLNIRVLFFATIGVAVLGTGLAVIRSLRGPVWFPLRALATIYTDLFRGVPVLIVLFLVGFGIPALEIFPRLPAGVWGGIAITLCYSAYVAEVLRAGMEAVHPSQRIAARSLGLTHAETLRVVVIPQGLRKVIPPLMNDFVSMQKDVGLISVLGAVDAVRAAQIEVAQSFNFTPYVVAALLFVALSFPVIRVTDHISARMARREQSGGTV
ncbi:amino acid ABC transporter permease [Demequina oxidasica]|uniref:amino acid ABC transporter permease n=1 Tax=Demequina oxidasica TaxID=676199 RepID=UPI0007855A0E|nr:amino acid ABC transporter permease [Demequina oxidasica]